MKRALWLVLLFSVALAAQRRGGGGQTTFQHRGGSLASARSAPYLSSAIYTGTYYRFGPQIYAPQYSAPPWGWWVNAPPPVLFLAAPVEERIIYIPTYMRPNDGPSLGEIARQLGGKKHKHPVDNKLE